MRTLQGGEIFCLEGAGPCGIQDLTPEYRTRDNQQRRGAGARSHAHAFAITNAGPESASNSLTYCGIQAPARYTNPFPARPEYCRGVHQNPTLCGTHPAIPWIPGVLPSQNSTHTHHGRVGVASPPCGGHAERLPAALLPSLCGWRDGCGPRRHASCAVCQREWRASHLGLEGAPSPRFVQRILDWSHDWLRSGVAVHARLLSHMVQAAFDTQDEPTALQAWTWRSQERATSVMEQACASTGRQVGGTTAFCAEGLVLYLSPTSAHAFMPTGGRPARRAPVPDSAASSPSRVRTSRCQPRGRAPGRPSRDCHSQAAL